MSSERIKELESRWPALRPWPSVLCPEDKVLRAKGPFGAADDAGGPGRAQLEELEQELKKTAGGKIDAQADGRGGL